MTGAVCPSCSHANTLGANFCSSCGVRIGEVRDDRTDAISLDEMQADLHRPPGAAGGVDAEADSDLGDGHQDADLHNPDLEDDGFDRSDFGPEVGVLFVQRGTKAGSRYALDNELTTAGRHPDSGIFLDDVTVSRRHAELRHDGATYTVRDLGSLNGTYVNRERVDEVALQDGDELQIGKFKLFFFHGTGA